MSVVQDLKPTQLVGIDHVEWWVGNARSFSAFLASGFGFEIVAHAGPETGRRDRCSYLLQQGDIRFLVTGALTPDSVVADHVRRHGDGVRDICFLVDDVEAAFNDAIARGAMPERWPAFDRDDDGEIHHAAIRTYGETVHTFLDRTNYPGRFAPQFEAATLVTPVGPDVGLVKVDHIVGNVERGHLDEWVGYYEQVFGFDQLVHFSDDQISTEYSALMSTVVTNGDSVVMPINEPADGRKKSQIEEYLDYYRSPGVQHIALRTDDIVATVAALRDRGIAFLDVPPEYYDEAKQRLEGIGADLPWADLQALGILVDRDDRGHLLQIFTETVTDRPTVFFEIIQREGARGFGEGNFKALFQSIERAQADAAISEPMEGVPQWIKGVASRQAHVALPPGTVEEEHGRDGFYGPASHLYRLHPPTSWISVDGPAAHQAFDLRKLEGTGPWPEVVLRNEQVAIGMFRTDGSDASFLRDADGDLAVFVHEGRGTLRTEYGPLTYQPGDYLIVPRGTTFRFETDEPTVALSIEARHNRYRLPERGLLGHHAVFDPAIIEVPEAEAVDETGEFTVLVKRGDETTRLVYPFHPCDVVGWKGDVAPMRLHVDDIRPVVSPRYHLPPSVHSTWVSDGFVICTFAPRPMEDDPEAVRLPFFHRNVDYDEVIFYHRGEFMSRAGLDKGMMTWHPTGLHHGPQPAARARDAAAGPGPRRAEEVAVMIDAREPLTPTDTALATAVPGYADSWIEDNAT